MKTILITLITAITLGYGQSLIFSDNGVNYIFTKDSVFIGNAKFNIKSVDVSYFGYGSFSASIYTNYDMYILTEQSMVVFNSYGVLDSYITNLSIDDDFWILSPWVNGKQTMDTLPPYDIHTIITPKYDYVSIGFR